MVSKAVCDTIIPVVFSVQIVLAIGFAISLWRAQHGHGDHLDFFVVAMIMCSMVITVVTALFNHNK